MLTEKRMELNQKLILQDIWKSITEDLWKVPTYSGFSIQNKCKVTVFCIGESHGKKSLMGYSPQGHKESDMKEVTQHAYTHQQPRTRN